MRDAITVKVDGLLLQGTSHIGPAGGDTGVLFLNSGSLPRSSRGDLYAHLAEQGFPSLRVDLPGLGDSQGEVPQEYVDFYRQVQEGAYAGTAVKVVRELRRTHGLARIVLAGICGGAQTSVFTAAKEHGADIGGLVLLDMPFFLYRGPNHVELKNASPSLAGRIGAAMARRKAKMRDWILAQKWEPQATKLYYGLKKLTRRSGTTTLPPNTNLPLLKALTAVLDQGIPALMVTAHPLIPEPQSFDYIGYVTNRAGGRFEHAEIRGTTHSFVENGGAEAVQAAVAGWLAKLRR